MKRILGSAVVGLTFVVGALLPGAATAVPAQFSDTVAFSGLNSPTSVAFAPDGRIFVAEQAGLIKVYDGVGDNTPTLVDDLRTEVHGFWDRGLLSLVIDPDFPSEPYLYVSYTYDAPIGGTAPTWGSPNNSNDGCASPPGPTDDGCVVSGRLSRLTVSGNSVTSEKVLIEDWCQQYPSHSTGDLGFGNDGNLYMSGGDGASFNNHDWGQDGNPLNPCGDPPAGVGGVQTAATGQGGALRSQDIRTTGDPLGLDGTLIRVNPDNGSPVPDVAANANPSAVNSARVVAFGFRNPFRFAIRPGTNEVWLGDVGWTTVEEINRIIPGAAGTTGNNFGWPCYEGPSLRPYSMVGMCQSLYLAGGAKPPYFAFTHGVKVVPSETCSSAAGSSITGLEFYEGGSGSARFPSSYNGALFFADYARGCIWVMQKGTNGLPDPNQVSMFQDTPGPVDLELAPDGSLFYVSLNTGTVHRIAYESQNGAPVARATASPDHGAAPLTVRLDASGSTDPNPGDQLRYAWDLDGDGQFDDSPYIHPTRVYEEEGEFHPRVRVTDQAGASSVDGVAIDVGLPPVPTIESPASGAAFSANETFQFSGSAWDDKDGAIAAANLDWTAVLNHCTLGGGCHEHRLQSFEGVSAGELAMPAHERPYFVTLTLIARDSDGLEGSTAIDLYPRPPTITDTDPDSPANDNNPEVKGSGAEAGSTVKIYGDWTCTGTPIGSGPAAGFIGPTGITATVPGNTTTNLRVTATDAAGNASACSSAFDYVEDSSAPETTITKHPKKKIKKKKKKKAKAKFEFASSEPGSSFACTLDRKPFKPCKSPKTVKRLRKGKHRFQVRAIDTAGNRDPSPATFKVKVVRKRKR